ncbi:hypothetical protein [Flavobacterium sp.]|uniref:hypothetical protein n=1 Tax=Flavobacterium sp. TaxID=239 RepID=UPI0031D22406
MKNLKAPILVIALLLLNVSAVFAKENPLPVPGDTQSLNAGDADPEEGCPPGAPCPVDFPIDQNINFLLIGGLALGAVAIYKNQTKKASI